MKNPTGKVKKNEWKKKYKQNNNGKNKNECIKGKLVNNKNVGARVSHYKG